MGNRTFDTLGTVHDLEATGIERPQAEAIAQAIGRNDEQLATKSDIERLEAQSATKSDIERLEAQSATKSDLHRLGERLEAQIATKADRAELYRALWIQGGGIVAILTALKFLP